MPELRSIVKRAAVVQKRSLQHCCMLQQTAEVCHVRMANGIDHCLAELWLADTHFTCTALHAKIKRPSGNLPHLLIRAIQPRFMSHFDSAADCCAVAAAAASMAGGGGLTHAPPQPTLVAPDAAHAASAGPLVAATAALPADVVSLGWPTGVQAGVQPAFADAAAAPGALRQQQQQPAAAVAALQQQQQLQSAHWPPAGAAPGSGSGPAAVPRPRVAGAAAAKADQPPQQQPQPGSGAG